MNAGVEAGLPKGEIDDLRFKLKEAEVDLREAKPLKAQLESNADRTRKAKAELKTTEAQLRVGQESLAELEEQQRKLEEA